MNITTRTKPDKIFKLFKEARLKDQVNLEIPGGYIYLVGGILSKLQDNIHYVAIKGRWVKI